MKNLSIILAAPSAGTSPIQSPEAPAPTEIVKPALPAERNGQEAVLSIRQTYQAGGYAEFLKELNDSYIAVKESGQLDRLAEMREGAMPDWQDWEEQAITLQNEKSQELLAAVKDQNKTPFVDKVNSAAVNISDASQQKAISQMTDLRALLPGQGKNSDENRLIEIDLEYEFKSLHLYLPGATPVDVREKLCALKMEKLDKMVAASKSFEDASLKETVSLYADTFDARLSQSWDAADLNDLTNGKKKPQDGLQEKIASILKTYQEKFSELTRAFLAEHENN